MTLQGDYCISINYLILKKEKKSIAFPFIYIQLNLNKFEI